MNIIQKPGFSPAFSLCESLRESQNESHFESHLESLRELICELHRESLCESNLRVARLRNKKKGKRQYKQKMIPGQED